MYITEYVKIDEKAKIAIRGVMMYREKRDLVEKQDKVLDIYVVYRAFPKRSQRKHLLLRLMSTKNVISAEIGKERVKDIYKDYLVFRCNVEKADFEILNKLKVRLKDYEAEDWFDKFFKRYERS